MRRGRQRYRAVRCIKLMAKYHIELAVMDDRLARSLELIDTIDERLESPRVGMSAISTAQAYSPPGPSPRWKLSLT